MSSADLSPRSRLCLRLCATSANVGPGFDALALALGLYLEIDAEASTSFSIQASGRDVEICSRIEGNLLLDVYGSTVRGWTGRQAPPLALTMRNGIPLGMGCGSSAASRLAGVALASHFAGLAWSRERMLAEACRLEGHPDNAAACWLGGFVASGWDAFAGRARSGREPAKEVSAATEPIEVAGIEPSLGPGGGQRLATGPCEEAEPVAAISIPPPPAWHALLVLPSAPLATTASRAVLPEHYSRGEIVLNLQRVALLTAAFAAGRGELLRSATADSLHQPYRGTVCPLLPLLLPAAGQAGILSVTLSGAGPAVLLILDSRGAVPGATAQVCAQVRGSGAAIAEILDCPLAQHSAEIRVETRVLQQ